MKRILSLLMTATLLSASLLGCSSQSATTESTTTTTTTTTESTATATDSTTQGERLSIITTIYPQYEFAREVAGDHADVSMLLSPGTESHSYEPTPQDIIAIQDCDLFIYTGGENDVWVDSILDAMGDDRPDTLRLLDCVDTVTEEIVEGMEHSHDHDDEEVAVTEEDHDHDHEDEAVTEEDHDHDHEDEAVTEEDHDHDHEDEAVTEEDHDHDHEDEAVTEEDHDHDHDHDHEDEEEEIDEHVWTSMRNCVEIVEHISALMSEKDSANAETYASNASAYIVQLEALDAAFQEVVDTAERNTILFGDRFPFRYFADDYGLEYYAAFTGCSTETEASAATVVFLIEKVQELDLPVVFTIELSTGKIADSIVESTDAVNLTFHSAHNITKDEVESGVTFLSIMEQNVENLRIALN